jgi:hypothetical protein
MINRSPATAGAALKHSIMRPLHTMNNVEKGKLLANLFPEQLPEILTALQKAYDFLSENEEGIRAQWDNGFIRFDFWYRVATDVANALQRNGKALAKSSHLFAEELFSHHNALFTIDCITKQAKDSENQKYRQAVALLFE